MSQLRPLALISSRAPLLLPQLHAAQLQPYHLLLQPPRATPPWEVVPPSPAPLLLDLVGLSLPTIAMALDDLRHRPAPSPVLLLVPPAAHGLHHLIAGSGVHCTILPAMAAPAQLAQGLIADPDAMPAPHQRWIDLPVPAPPHVDVRFLRLAAALSHAPHMQDVATRLFLHRATVYRLLGRTAARLALPLAPQRKRRTRQWLALLSTALLLDPCPPYDGPCGQEEDNDDRVLVAWGG